MGWDGHTEITMDHSLEKEILMQETECDEVEGIAREVHAMLCALLHAGDEGFSGVFGYVGGELREGGFGEGHEAIGERDEEDADAFPSCLDALGCEV